MEPDSFMLSYRCWRTLGASIGGFMMLVGTTGIFMYLSMPIIERYDLNHSISVSLFTPIDFALTGAVYALVTRIITRYVQVTTPLLSWLFPYPKFIDRVAHVKELVKRGKLDPEVIEIARDKAKFQQYVKTYGLEKLMWK